MSHMDAKQPSSLRPHPSSKMGPSLETPMPRHGRSDRGHDVSVTDATCPQLTDSQRDFPDAMASTPSCTQSSDLSIAARHVTQPAQKQGWRQTINPLGWWTRTSTEKPQPQVRKAGLFARLKNQYLSAWSDPPLFKYLNTYIAPWLEGLTAHDLINALKAASSIYNQKADDQEAEPQLIRLNRLHFPNTSIWLEDVSFELKDVSLDKAEPDGEGTCVTLRGNAAGTLLRDENSPLEPQPVEISGMELQLFFEEEHLVRNLLEKGALSSTLLGLGRSLLHPGKMVKPYKIRTHITSAQAGHTSDSEGPAQVCIKLRNTSLDLDLGPSPQLDVQEDNFATRLQVRGLDMQAEGSHLQALVPESLRPQLARLFPQLSHNKSTLEIKAPRVDLTKNAEELKLEVPRLEINSSGDIELTDGDIIDLTLTKRVQKDSSAPGETVPGAQVPAPELSVGFGGFIGMLKVPRASLNQPFHLEGAVHLKEADLQLSRKQGSRSDADRTRVNCTLEQVTTDIKGDVELTGAAQKISVLWDSESQEGHTHVEQINLENFALAHQDGAKPDGATALAGKGTIEDVTLTRKSGKNVTHTQLNLGRIRAQDVEGRINTGLLDLQQAQIIHIHASQPAVAESAASPPPLPYPEETISGRIRQATTQGVQIPLQEGTHFQVAEGRLEDIALHCKIGSAPRTRTEQADFERQLSTAPKPWQKPEDRVVCTDLKVNASKLVADAKALSKTGPEATGERPIAGGKLVCSAPSVAIHHDADHGWEYLHLNSDNAQLALTHQESPGHIKTQGLNAQIQRGTDQHPDQVTGAIAMNTLEATAVQLPAALLPEGIEMTLNSTLHEPQLEAQLPIPRPATDAGTANQSTGPDLRVKVKDSRTEAQLQIAAQTLPTLPTAVAVDAQMPAWQKVLLTPLLRQAAPATQNLNETGKAEPLQQHLVLNTEEVVLGTRACANNERTSDLSAHQAELAMTSGALTGNAALSDLRIRNTRTDTGTVTDLALDSATVNKAHTNPTSHLPLQVALQSPAVIHGLEAHADTRTQRRHIGIVDAALDCNFGINPASRTGPETSDATPALAHVQAQINNAHLNQDGEGNTLATLDTARFNLNQTSDQLGAAIAVCAEGKNFMANTAIKSERITAQMQIGAMELDVSGDVNGKATAYDIGFTVDQNTSQIRISPNLPQNQITLEFPQLVRELLELANRGQQVQNSALGSLCDLKLYPELDSALNGRIGFAASGALSPFIGLLLGITARGLKRRALKLTRFLTKNLHFRLELQPLQVTAGQVHIDDLIRNIQFSVMGTRGRASRFCARIISKIINTTKNRMTTQAARYIQDLAGDNAEGKVSLTQLLQAARQHIALVSLPGSPLPPTGDALRDAHNHTRAGIQLPDSWTPDLYERLLNKRIAAMRWCSSPVAQHAWGNPARCQSLCKKIVKDYPLPTRAEEFRRIESRLSALQSRIRHCSAAPCLEDIYNQLEFEDNRESD